MRWLVWLLLAVSIALNVWQWDKYATASETAVETRIIRDSVLIPYKVTEYLPMQRKLQVVNHVDTVTDSVEVYVPMTQKEYRDSTYHIWVSGYEPKIDSIELRLPTKIVYKHRRWGIGLQVGAGYNGKIAPYIGVGISYNLISF